MRTVLGGMATLGGRRARVLALAGMLVASTTITLSSAAPVGAVNEHDLVVYTSATHEPMTVGLQSAIYVQVSNVGVDPAVDAELTNVVPAGFTIDSVSNTDCSFSGQTVTCSFAEVWEGSPAWTYIFVTPTAATTGATNTASVVAHGSYDLDNSNDTSTLNLTAVDLAPVDLVVTKTASQDPMVVGEPYAFYLQVDNNGPMQAQGVLLTDVVPAGFTIDSVSNGLECGVSGQEVTCDFGGVSPGDVKSTYVYVTPTAVATAVTNTATVSTLSNDVNPTNDSASVTVDVQSALTSIAVTPDGAVVGTGTYQAFTVEGFNASGVSLGDHTAQAVFTISPNGNCNLNSCRSGTTGLKTVTAQVGTYTATATLDVRTSQTITFPTIGGRTMLQSPVAVSATASSGLPVTFTTTTPDVCTAGGTDGSSITLLGPGTCTVQADQPGDDTWAPAVPRLRSFTVSQVAQTITFGTLANVQITASPVTVAATASSGLPVTFTTTTPDICDATGSDGSSIVLLDAGRCTVRAEQPGDSNYRAATAVNRSFTVSKLANTITFPAVGTRTLAESPVTVTATASSGLPVTFSTTTPTVCTSGGADGSTITLLEAGTCTVRAEQPGDAVHAAANPVNRNFTVARVAQTITFPAIGARSLVESPITVSATASSGLPVTFTTTTPTVCEPDGADGSSIILLATGTCTVRAEQAGDDYWNSAAQNRSFTVTPPPPAVQTFTASPTLVSSAGGLVELTATVEFADNCRFTVSPALAGFPLTVPCTDGTAAATAAIPANATASSRFYTFGFVAIRGGAPNATATGIAVRVAPASELVADLSVTGTESADPARTGRPLTYTFTVANAGPDTVPAVDFTATLPPGIAVASTTATQGSGCVEAAGVLTCPLLELASGGTADVTIVLRPLTPGSASITGTVTSAATDVNPGDESATLFTTLLDPPIVYTDDQTATVRRMESFGGAVALTTQPGGKSDAVVSPDGQTVVYWRQSPAPDYVAQIWMVDIDGTDERFVADVGTSMVLRPSWAPDSSKIVFSVLTGGKWKAMVASAVGDPDPQLLIPDMTYGESSPAFSPDGTKIIFRDSCQRPAPAQCRYHLVNADGSGTPTAYTTYLYGGGVVWDPDGEWFYYAASNGTIYRARVDGTLAEPVVTGTYGGTYWSLSPQGDRIAYTAIVGGKPVIAVVDVDGSNQQQLTTPYAASGSAGCYSPVWTPDQTKIVMHCYPGSGAIGIYRVASDLTAPVAPTSIGGSFRSRNPELAGSRPTH